MRRGAVRDRVGGVGVAAGTETASSHFCISPVSPLYLRYISAISPLYLPYISPISPLYLMAGTETASSHFCIMRMVSTIRPTYRVRVRVRVRG